MNPYLQLLKKSAESSDDLPTKPSEAAFVGFVGDTSRASTNFFRDSYVGFGATEAAANTGESEELQTFWSNFVDRISLCDLLIYELCNVRGDDQARRDALILTRRRMAPTHIDSDIRYLLEEIERVAPTPPPGPIRDCRKRFRRILINLYPEFAAVWDALVCTKNFNNSAVAELLLLQFAEQEMDSK